jgi:hypothetical protein
MIKTAKYYSSYISLLLLTTVFLSCGANRNKSSISQASILLDHVRLIDGNGGAPVEDTRLLLKDGKIAAIGADISDKDATVINLEGKTVMPAH